MKNVFLLFLLSILLTAHTCEKTSDCLHSYRFDFPVTISPTQPKYTIGDTIWIEIEYEHTLTDLNSGNLIEVGDFDFRIDMLMSVFDSTSLSDAIDRFSVIPLEGQLIRQDLATISTYNLGFQTNGDKQIIRYGMIPLKTGFYFLGFDSFFTRFDKVTIQDTNCNERLTSTFTTNNAIDNYFDFYKSNSPDENVTLEGYNKEGAFSFEVTE